jgi:hypothetical protein
MINRCERAIAAMAIGGPIRRWQAMRHAARCPRCAAVRDELRQVAEALADVPPLNDAQRRLWAAAADELRKEPSLAFRLKPALAGALAAVILVGVGVWWMSRPQKLPPAPEGVASVEPPPAKQETLGEMEGLRGDVVALGRELDDLRHRAELLDARKDVDALMARLTTHNGPSGL